MGSKASCALAGVRALKRLGVKLAVAALMVATVPLALVLALGLAGCDLIAKLRRPARRVEPPRAHRPGPSDAVSVVIPTWNGRSLLDMSIPPLIEALRRHGHPDDEIIVVDNGSDDDTLAALAEMATAAASAGPGPLLRWISLPTNEGFAGATNRGRPLLCGWLTLVLGIGGFYTWAFLAPLDQGITAVGQVTVTGNRKTVQPLLGGKIAQILVKEDDLVKAGQPVVLMDATSARSQLDIALGQWVVMRAVEARLVAERLDRATIVYPADLLEQKELPAAREASTHSER